MLAEPERWLAQARVGLVANPTTVDGSLRHAAELLHNHKGVDLKLLFGPEHGLRGDAQDMVGVDDTRDPITGLPVVSLYGKSAGSLLPAAKHLQRIDVLVFDIQDVGSRYYTYAATMALCMRAAAEAHLKMLVLDRPNPIGGVQVEGGGLDDGLESFVGLYPVPQRHGMTVGELARLYNTTFEIGCDLTVVACEGWRRQQYYDTTGLPWVMPSPNLPTLDTALVYPGMCLLEGTNLSEGRGTTRPFELFGAPFIDAHRIAQELKRADLPGVELRPCAFRPTFHKFKGEGCGGLQLYVTDRQAFLPYRTGLAVLWAVHNLWPDALRWRRQVYEFRDDVPALDLLTGRAAVREAIDAGKDFEGVMHEALAGADLYRAARPAALLYD